MSNVFVEVKCTGEGNENKELKEPCFDTFRVRRRDIYRSFHGTGVYFTVMCYKCGNETDIHTTHAVLRGRQDWLSLHRFGTEWSYVIEKYHW